jgi:acetyltransferase-like isoleucine patch superfamily enzyme
LTATPVVIVGAGNLGALLLDCLDSDERWRPVAFIDDGKAGRSLHGLPIFDSVSYDPGLCRHAFLAIGFPAERRMMQQKVAHLGLDWQTFIDRRSQVGSHAEIGVGSLVLSVAMVASGVRVGDFSYLSSYSYAGTCAVLGRFVALMAGATAGDCVVGDDCILGLKSACIDGAVLGSSVTVAPYTLVRKAVPDGSLVTGNPARIFRRSIGKEPIADAIGGP